MDRSERRLIGYWLKPITRIRVKQMAMSQKKPVGHVLEKIVNEEYERFEIEKTTGEV